VLRTVHNLGRRAGFHVGCHSFRHSSITQAAILGQRAGLGLDKIRTHSRHRSITTLLTYIDGQRRAQTQRLLSDLVAGTLREKATATSRL
jgi:integrase